MIVDELSAQANEATNEMVLEQMKLKKEEEARRANCLDKLPWDTDDESKSIISQGLMGDVFQLALSEKNFTEPPPLKIMECCQFDFQKYVGQAMRLLQIDQNLAHIHSKVSPKMDEELFWKYYFSRVFYLKCKSGLLDSNDAIVQTVSSFDEENVIFKDSSNSKNKETEKARSSPPKNVWESSSSEEVSNSGMSMSSFEVLNASGASDNEKPKGKEKENGLELAGQLESVEANKDDINNQKKEVSEDSDNDFEDLDEFDDLEDLDGDVDDDDDDDELEAQIARELANEE